MFGWIFQALTFFIDFSPPPSASFSLLHGFLPSHFSIAGHRSNPFVFSITHLQSAPQVFIFPSDFWILALISFWVPVFSKCPSDLEGFLVVNFYDFMLMVYDLTHLISTFYIKAYGSLTKIQRIEWNSRGISSIHAIFITALSLYFVFWSDLFSDQQHLGLITFRSSPLSVFGLGVSVGYFCSDLGMLLWLYPCLGGMEYVFHHSLAGIAVAYSMFSGEGQLYTYMILISEITTPEINMRWYLDTAGLKRSSAYLLNGIVIFLSWLAARILLFGYMFYHVYLHYDMIIQMHTYGYLLVFVVPSVLAVMNLMWFGKIIKGLMKQLAKMQ